MAEIVMEGDKPGDRVHEIGLRINILKLAYEQERDRVFSEHEPHVQKWEVLKRSPDTAKDFNYPVREPISTENVLKAAKKYDKFIYDGMTVEAAWKKDK